MTCAEFQRALPEIIDTGGSEEYQEHLKSCPVCADLVADLQYIAEQAKLLVPLLDPPHRVWEGIERSLGQKRGAGGDGSGGATGSSGSFASFR